MTKKQEILNEIASALSYFLDRGEVECIQEISALDGTVYNPYISVDGFIIIADNGEKFKITAEKIL